MKYLISLPFICCIIFLTSCDVVRYSAGAGVFSKMQSAKSVSTAPKASLGSAVNLAIPIIKLIAEVVKPQEHQTDKPIAKLVWLTDTSKAQKNVELLYSLNGMDWNDVPCKNIAYYQIKDTLFIFDKMPKKGVVQYKIRQEYTDKTYTTSETVMAEITDVNMVLNAITPNVLDYLKIDVFSDKTRNGELKITNVIGKVLYNQKVKLNTNNNSLSINVESYKKGNYYVELSDNNSTATVNSAFYKN